MNEILSFILSPDFTIVLLPLFLCFLFFIVGGYFAGRARKLYSRNTQNHQFFRTGCPLCGVELPREKYTDVLFLLPYTFKILRHWEQDHPDIKLDARRARVSFTLSSFLLVHSIAAMIALKPFATSHVFPPWGDALQIFTVFIIPYLLIQLILWFVVAYVLVRKKGAIWEMLT
ncbi:MAG: hypothetical protein ACTSYL_04470 [Candidatus Thorarchaeota archaeon]